MIENYHHWHSSSTGRDFDMLVFGGQGTPLILFPTSMGTYYESKDRGMIASIERFINDGKIKVYCPDSIDLLSWYNKHISPAERAYNHNCYDKLIMDEVLGRAFYETGASKAIVAGCSFGGYHAANFAFRHPEKISYLFSMSGAFDIKAQVDGYYDDAVYFNSPVDYLPDNNDAALWNLGIILGIGEHDICRKQNEELSALLHKKNINHWLDLHSGAVHDWPFWKAMLPHYLSLVV